MSQINIGERPDSPEWIIEPIEEPKWVPQESPEKVPV